MLVGKQAYNKRLLKKYSKRARRKLKGRGKSRGDKSDVGKDYRLRVLKKKGQKVKVRDLFGNEGWVEDRELY